MGTLLLLTLLAPTSRPLAPQLQAASHASRAITQIEYEGTLIYEGHARHPGDLRAYHFRQRFATDGADRVRTDYATWKDGDTLIVPETWVLVGDRIVHRDAPDKPWEEFAGVHGPSRRDRARGRQRQR